MTNHATHCIIGRLILQISLEDGLMQHTRHEQIQIRQNSSPIAKTCGNITISVKYAVLPISSFNKK